MDTLIKAQPVKKINTTSMQKITPFLWFDTRAEEAVNFYTSTFADSRIKAITYYGVEGAAVSGREEGSVMTIDFIIEGQEFAAINGGRAFELTPAISLFVNCEHEQELISLWEKLSEGGTVLMELNKYPFSDKFGWLKDKFGVTWQFMISTGMQKITPFLMFTGRQYGKAEEAMKLYISLFKHSGIIHIEYYGAAEEEHEGTVKYARFSLNEQEFMATDSNTGHEFTFTPALSFVVKCDTQDEIDHFWNNLALGADVNAQQCGWLQDRFGVSWQIVPRSLDEMINDPDTTKAARVIKAMLPMKKLNLKTLEEAYEQE